MASTRAVITSTSAAVMLTLAAVVALAREDHGAGPPAIEERGRNAPGLDAPMKAVPARGSPAYGILAQATAPGSQPPGSIPGAAPGVPGAPTVAQPPPMREPARPGVDERPLSSRVYGHDPERDRRSYQYRPPLQSAPLPGETR